MAKAIAIFTGGITELRQVAIREDGVAFRRGKFHNHYGMQWSKWAPTGETFGHNATANVDTVEDGFVNLLRASPSDCFINNRALFDDRGEIKVRLP